ncbi:unnamed protein product, partial [Amoebophrya sp. A25]
LPPPSKTPREQPGSWKGAGGRSRGLPLRSSTPGRRLQKGGRRRPAPWDIYGPFSLLLSPKDFLVCPCSCRRFTDEGFAFDVLCFVIVHQSPMLELVLFVVNDRVLVIGGNL